jgi:Putative DNA-binding domain
MSITNIDLQSVSKTDLEALEAFEGLQIEYKRDLYARTADGAEEFLKDVSSFANTAGGHIIIGMDENGGLPTNLIGIEGNLDAEKQRLESLLRDRIEPRMVGIGMQPVPLSNGRNALVIRIPKSWNPPHAMVVNHGRRFYARNSAGAHPASVDELRAMFTAASTFLDRAREFHRKRLLQLHNNDTPPQFPELGGRLVLHIVPFSAFGSETMLDPKAMECEDLPPLWSRGYNRGYNVEGYLTTHEGGQSRAFSYLQVFRNGIIETVAGDVREPYASGTLRLRAVQVESEVIQRVSSSMTALSHAEVQPPMLIMLGGARMDKTMVVGPEVGFGPPSPPSLLRKSELHLPAVTIEGYGEMSDYARALKQVFDALWNAAGYRGSQSYDATGTWNPCQ